MPMNVPAGVKVKSLNIRGKTAGGPWTWLQFWTTDWDWTWVKTEVDTAASIGANTVKITAPLQAVLIGGSTSTTAVANFTTYLNYVQSSGLLAYINLAEAVADFNSEALADVATGMAALQTMLNGYSNVVGVDVINEINFIAPDLTTGESWMSTFTPALKGASSLPITYSLVIGAAGEWGSPTWINPVATESDFHDFHPYYDGGVTADGTDPAPEDVIPYRSLAGYLPWIVGEIGSVTSSGEANQVSRMAANAVLSAMYDCYGANYFCLADYDPTYVFGVYDDTFTPRSWLVSGFEAWPSEDTVTYTATVITDGAVGLWELAEASGTVAVDQVGNSDGAYSPTGITLGQTGIPGGGGATAAKFTAASSGDVTIPQVTAQDVGDIFTLECWVKAAAAAPEAVLVGGQSYTGPPPGLLIAPVDGATDFYGYPLGNAVAATGSAPIPGDGSFHHVVWTKNGSANHLYLDGVDVTEAGTNRVCANATGWVIGNDIPDGNLYFDGTLAMVAVYATALTAEQVANHYALGSTPPSAANSGFLTLMGA